MASLSSFSSSLATFPPTARQPSTISAFARVAPFRISTGIRLCAKMKIRNASVLNRSVQVPGRFKPTITCCMAQPETLQAVQSTIAKQLSIDECSLSPGSMFADLGADSLDIVEIMMALEENFGVTIGEEGAQNIQTVQDAADVIEKLKAKA